MLEQGADNHLSEPSQPAGESEAAAEAGAAETFVRVPVDHLGKALDHGPASVYAVRLLIEKHRHGPGYVLNQSNLGKKRAGGGIEMSRRGFDAGLGVLKQVRILFRRQGGRRRGGRGAFARETLAASRRGYVPIRESALVMPFKAVAFIAATLLSPHPRPAHEVAARIGLRGKVAIARLIEQARANGYISAARTKDGWIVGRPGVDLAGFKPGEFPVKYDAAENDAIESGAVENDAAHSKKGEGHRKLNEAHNTKRARVQEQEGDPSGAKESLAGAGPHDFYGANGLKELTQELRQADCAGAVAGYLLTARGMRGYAALLQRHGRIFHEVVKEKLWAWTLDGVEPCKVTSWSYFEGAALDEAKRAWLQANGVRPGDVRNLHRTKPLETDIDATENT